MWVEGESEGRYVCLPAATPHPPQPTHTHCSRPTLQSLYDTPGVVLPHAISYSLFPAHLMAPLRAPAPLAPRRALRLGASDTLLLEAAWMDGGADGAANVAVAGGAGGAGGAEASMLLARVDVLPDDPTDPDADEVRDEAGGGGMAMARVGQGEDELWARVLCPPSVRARVLRACAAPAHAAPQPAERAALVRDTAHCPGLLGPALPANGCATHSVRATELPRCVLS